MVAERPLTAAEIYEQVTGGNGPGRLSTAAEATARLRRALADLAADVRGAAGQADRGWEGEAGRRAALLAMPLALASETDEALLRDVDRTLSDQITAFAGTRDSVVPVPPQPPAPTKEDLVRDLLGGDSYRTKLDAYERDAATNVAAFRSYHQASTVNSGAIPARYAPLSADAAEITLSDANETTGVSVAQTRTSGQTSSPGLFTVEPASTPASSAPTYASERNTDIPRTPKGTTEPEPESTHAAAHTPPPPAPSEHHSGPSGPPGRHTVSPTPTGIEPTGRLAAQGRGPGSGQRDTPGAGGPASRSNRQTNLPPNAHGRTPAAPPGQQPLPGRGSGAGTAERPGGDVARGGTPPTAGGAGSTSARTAAGPAPVGTAGRGGGDDKDRRRPGYLREPDPEDTFSDPLPKTPPPVIGHTDQTPRGGT
ncbi:hypothetical protein [Saccharomonospora xinjiangensis]|uniref:PPE family protein n=1 Tax=Saccharomonospora xinjiangensis XJ-54 TaxID=882086 RepID=I0V1D8_9PSEU|nr:hypothetical protein [Saccharomonospora xinjiangensis]EID53941.1 hypothetical protein SacxiDRAFT_1699 [Saccharomonospora xinjiangensis XJ-54]